jgi:RHH-type proline utilization regulon transcriptional repressor/proline dehydrogenase/delta 1-pyrroline-5-carboxylate dehydrogenase
VLAAKDDPIAPLIAETGGVDAMLVDSSALPEQVADAVIEMIQGAAQELVLGNPAELTTDVGPVIDREAFDNIQNHL